MKEVIMGKNKVRHMVIFTLNHPEGSQLVEDFLKESQSILSSISTVNQFLSFKQTSIKCDYDYGFSMDFNTKEDYEYYLNHPSHLDYVKNRWLPNVGEFLEIDFNI
jgi:hypothetical protein